MRASLAITGKALLIALVFVSVAGGVFLLKSHHAVHLTPRQYLVFHTMAELFGIVVSAAFCMIAWNARRVIDNHYLLFLGIAFGCVAVISSLHMLAYKGINLFNDPGGNLATQLWIASRYAVATAFLGALLFVRRRLNVLAALAGWAAATVLLLMSIFYWHNFPDCLIPGVGLTRFKVVSENLTSLALLLAGVGLLTQRQRFSRLVLMQLLSGIMLLVLASASFTLYSDPYGPFNFLGHCLQVAALFLIYRAFVKTAMSQPITLLFHNLKQHEQTLQRRVDQRTSDLNATVDSLQDAVSERVAAQESLRESERRFRQLIELSPEAIAIVRDDNVAFINPAGLRLLGASEFSQVAGKPITQFIHPDDLDLVNARMSSVNADRLSPLRQTRMVGLHGEATVIEFRIIEIEYGGQPAFLVFARDITERQRLEKEVLDIVEGERRQIGQDLHDSLGQMLTGLSFMSKLLENSLKSAGRSEADTADAMTHRLQEAVRLTRSLSRGLCPVEISADGLMQALQEFAEQVEQTYGVACQFDYDRPVLLADGSIAAHVYQIVREAVNNAVKHGRCGSVQIGLYETEAGGAELIVRDDGVGLPDSIDEGKGVGLNSMRYRASLIGSELTIQSDPDGGVVVSCVLGKDAFTQPVAQAGG